MSFGENDWGPEDDGGRRRRPSDEPVHRLGPDDEVTRYGGPTARWSRPPQDLEDEVLLHHCRRELFEGAERPVLGRYVLLSKLGQGGMGAVYHAVHPRLGVEVAIKLLPLQFLGQDSGVLQRFEREARLAAQLESPHLVSVKDIDEDDASRTHFIVMEYVRGEGANDWSTRFVTPGAFGAPEGPALDVCVAATRGLVVAHRAGTVHRDIKPSNILVPVDDDGFAHPRGAKLADLGLARGEGADQSLTGTQVAMGTPGYMAPEQAMNARLAKKPADVFSVGATLYALLGGNAPFAGASVAQSLIKTATGDYRPLNVLRPDLSPPTLAIIKTCLATDPDDRYPDAPALLRALLVCRKAVGEGRAGEADRARVLRYRQSSEEGERVPSSSLPGGQQDRRPPPQRRAPPREHPSRSSRSPDARSPSSGSAGAGDPVSRESLPRRNPPPAPARPASRPAPRRRPPSAPPRRSQARPAARASGGETGRQPSKSPARRSPGQSPRQPASPRARRAPAGRAPPASRPPASRPPARRPAPARLAPPSSPSSPPSPPSPPPQSAPAAPPKRTRKKSRVPWGWLISAVVILGGLGALMLQGGQDWDRIVAKAEEYAQYLLVSRADEKRSGAGGEETEVGGADVSGEELLPTPRREVPPLEIKSVPRGAVVLLDGEVAGETPLTVDNLTLGSYELVIRADGCEEFTQTAHTGRHHTAPVNAILTRLRRSLEVTAGAPGAVVTLERAGDDPRRYELTLDENGRHTALEIETGDYAVRATADGFADFEGRLVVIASRPAAAGVDPPAPLVLDLVMPALPAVLSLATAPPGAEVLIDGTLLGATPIVAAAVPAGEHVLHVSIAGHRPFAKNLDLDRGEVCDLALIELVPYGLLDLTGLDADVEACVVDGNSLSGLVELPPEGLTVRFTKRGMRPQVLEIRVPAGEREPPALEAWQALPGRLDLSALPENTVVRLGDRVVTEESEVGPGTHEVTLQRVGFEPVTCMISVEAGRATRVADPGGWVRATSDFETARQLLGEVQDWDTATSEERRIAAEAVLRKLRGFRAREAAPLLETFSAGGVSHEVAIFLHERTGMEFCLIPVGAFSMGSPEDERGREANETRHPAAVARPFLMSRTEVTRAVWTALMEDSMETGERAGHAISDVTYQQMRTFCERAGARLPLEREWEYACRAGTTSRYWCGTTEEELERSEWVSGNSSAGVLGLSSKVEPVGTKRPNPFGLFDMLGSVAEACSDAYAELAATAPGGGAAEDTESTPRVLRGGSRESDADEARSACRARLDPDDREDVVGLRLVVPVPSR